MAGEKMVTAASWCPRLQRKSRQARSCKHCAQPLGKLQERSLDSRHPREQQAKLCQSLGVAGRGWQHVPVRAGDAPPQGEAEPRASCTNCLRRVRKARAWGHGAAWDVPWQLSCTSCRSRAGTTLELPAGNTANYSSRWARALPGERDKLSRVGSSLHRDGAGSTSKGCVNKQVLFLKKTSGSFSPVPCFPHLFLSICPSHCLH